jgi:hypothetical protein
MTEKTDHLRVKNWRKHQPYKEANEDGVSIPPGYILVKLTLLRDPEFCRLEAEDQRFLFFVWMLNSQVGNGKMPNDPEYIAGQIPKVPELEHRLSRLIEQGWLIPCRKGWRSDTSPILDGGDSRAPKVDRQSLQKDQTPAGQAARLWKELHIKPQCVSLSPQRRSAVAARAREHGMGSVLDVIRKRADSDFLSFTFGDGRGAGFDWCFGPKNFVKILDGNYDNRKRGQARAKASDTGSAGDLLVARKCAQRRQLNPDRLERDELFDLLNADLFVCREHTKRRGFDAAGMTPQEVIDWYIDDTGQAPHLAEELRSTPNG